MSTNVVKPVKTEVPVAETVPEPEKLVVVTESEPVLEESLEAVEEAVELVTSMAIY